MADVDKALKAMQTRRTQQAQHPLEGTMRVRDLVKKHGRTKAYSMLAGKPVQMPNGAIAYLNK
ncbi:hypothetical protein [Rothia amarae]|uniref:hypothetical protein n=1 Tax=Rothia amarae TaxID=169480 RepID=UPI00340370F3